jgi:PAS domain S-box-containing protein
MAAERPKIDGRVLLLAPTMRDGQASRALLASAGIDCVLCTDLTDLCGQTAQGAAALIVPEEVVQADDAEELAQALHRQPVWSDLPVIVLSRAALESPAVERALATLGNVSVVERPVRVNTLLSVVRSALRARERQYQLRDYLAAQKEIEEKLREGEERLRLAVQTGKLGVWELDLVSRDLQTSDGFLATFGRPPAAAFSYDELCASLHPDDRERVRDAVRKAITDRTEYDTEYRCIWPDGTMHWMLVRGRAIYSPDGTPLRMTGVTLDITERKTAEEQRSALLESERSARTEAERASRVKDEFLATLSHELRTPLNAILGWAQILRGGNPEAEDWRDGLEVIERNARAQTQIIEDLLDMSRIIGGKIRLEVRPITLASVIRAAAETVRPAADAKSVTIKIVDEMPEPMLADPNRLQQVFWNLLSNAVKFTPRHGGVEVKLGRVESHIEVSVSDTGEGIKADFLPYVFDRFRQADSSSTRRHGGLGLGLAIVKQLVELHGGSVRVTSGGAVSGATFTVSLPLSALQPEPEIDEEPSTIVRRNDVRPENAPLADLHGIKVLVVDDEPDARSLVQRLLQDRGAVVFTAGSAAEAVGLVSSERPNVLVSDIGMPREDGYSLIGRVRALGSEQGGTVPAVALTAYARAEDRISAIKAGFQVHATKPVEPRDLIAIVSRLAGQEFKTPPSAISTPPSRTTSALQR